MVVEFVEIYKSDERGKSDRDRVSNQLKDLAGDIFNCDPWTKMKPKSIL